VIMMTCNLAYGDMNGQQSAAVILVTNPGGSGTFYDLHLMFAPQGQAVNPASAFLGDRVQINDLKIENSLIVVDMIQAGPNDPMCCPSQHVIKSYSWEKDNLVEVSSEVVEDSAAAPQLVGPVWQWQQSKMSDGMTWEPPDPASYIIEFTAEGQVSIQADCNRGGGYQRRQQLDDHARSHDAGRLPTAILKRSISGPTGRRCYLLFPGRRPVH
jgi:hypothetical protein